MSWMKQVQITLIILVGTHQHAKNKIKNFNYENENFFLIFSDPTLELN